MLLIYFAGVSEASLHISHAQLLNVPIHLILVLWVGTGGRKGWNCGIVELWFCVWCSLVIHSPRESLASFSNPSHPLRYYCYILCVYFFYTGLEWGFSLFVYWCFGFVALHFFNTFKTGVALNNQSLFHIQNEMIACKANQSYFYFSW